MTLTVIRDILNDLIETIGDVDIRDAVYLSKDLLKLDKLKKDAAKEKDGE